MKDVNSLSLVAERGMAGRLSRKLCQVHYSEVVKFLVLIKDEVPIGL